MSTIDKLLLVLLILPFISPITIFLIGGMYFLRIIFSLILGGLPTKTLLLFGIIYIGILIVWHLSIRYLPPLLIGLLN